MTNEELVAAIQGGQTDLMEFLWKQNEGFVVGMAIAWKRAFETHSDFDAEDLVQSGWFALLDTVSYFDPGREDCSFLSLFKLCLRQQFRSVIGIRTSKRDASFFASLSLNSPVNADDPEGITLVDTVPDPASTALYEAMEDASEREHIHDTMSAVAGEVLTGQQLEIYRSLLAELRCSDIGRENALSGERIRQRREQIYEALRGDPRILQLWLDVTDQRESVEDIADRFVMQVGVASFRELGASSVERAVLRIIDSDRVRREKREELKQALERRLHAAGEAVARKKRQQQKKQMLSDLADYDQQRTDRLALIP